jgi:hypothetical protein
MPKSSAELVADVVNQLRHEAKTQNLDIHPSLEIELRNYAQHEQVRELGDADLAKVITGIGRHAFSYAQMVEGAHSPQVAAGAVRQVLNTLCPDWCSDCWQAARSLINMPVTRAEIVSSVVSQLRADAATREVEIHPSFEVELRNYAGHEKVRDLSAPKMKTVLSGIGRHAFTYAQPIQGTSRRQLGAGGVRRVVLELCHDSFSDCSGAARTILEGGADSD